MHQLIKILSAWDVFFTPTSTIEMMAWMAPALRDASGQILDMKANGQAKVESNKM